MAVETRRKKKRRQPVIEEVDAYTKAFELDEQIRELENDIRERLSEIDVLRIERDQVRPDVRSLGMKGTPQASITWERKREWMYKVRRFTVQLYAGWRGSDNNAANSDIQRLVNKGFIEWVPGTTRPKSYRLVAIERKRQERTLRAEGRENEIRVPKGK